AVSRSLNNLRQMGFAVHAFVDSNKASVPPAVGKVQNLQGTAHLFMLPYLEQNELYQKAAKGESVHGVVVRLYLAEEDKYAPLGNLYKGWLATTNYPINWLVSKDGTVKLADITDGTSNTLLFAQRYQTCRRDPCGWAYAELYYWAPIFAYYSQARFQ